MMATALGLLLAAGDQLQEVLRKHTYGPAPVVDRRIPSVDKALAAWATAVAEATVAELPSLGLRVARLSKEIAAYRDLVERKERAIAERTDENAVLTERLTLAHKALRYVAFVLTGDENADPQAAADKVAGEKGSRA